MSTIQVGLVIIIVILFCMGIWPVALAALGALIYISKQQPKEPKPKRTIEDLEKENEILRQELANQAVRHAMDKAESREKKG